MTSTPDTKGAQPEQLVERARRLVNQIHREGLLRDVDGRDLDASEVADLLDGLYTALSECRERLERIAENAESWHAGEDGKAKALAVIADWARNGPLYRDFQRVLANTAAQPPSEASERSGT